MLGNNVKEFYKLCKIDKANENVYDNSENKDSNNIVRIFNYLDHYSIMGIYWVDEKNKGEYININYTSLF